MTGETAAASAKTAAPLTPASSVVLLREHAGRVETLLTRRHAAMSFGGLWVFAGGKVEDSDRVAAAQLTAVPPPMRRHHAPDIWLEPAEVRPFFTAAARELVEETGMLLEGGPDSLVHFAHWVTPPGLPRRFDTHFFLGIAMAGAALGVACSEVDEFCWVEPRAAVEAARCEELPCAPVTAFTLFEVAEALDRHGSLIAMLAGERGRDVLPIMPKLDRDLSPPSALLPWHPRYHELPGEGVCAALPIPEYYRRLPACWVVPASLVPRKQAAAPAERNQRWTGATEADHG